MVPSVHAAVASPLASVIATRGLVLPFPAVTASATATLGTGLFDASVTRTASAPGMESPTCADRVRGVIATSLAGGPWVELTGSSPPHATMAPATQSADHRR